MEEILGDQLLHEESWVSTQVSFLSEKQEHCQSPTNVLQPSTVAHVSHQTVRHRDEGVLEWDSCPTSVQLKGFAKSTGIFQRIPELAGLTLVFPEESWFTLSTCDLPEGVWR